MRSMLRLLAIAGLSLLLGACATDRPLETACPSLDDFAFPKLAGGAGVAGEEGPDSPRDIAGAFAAAYRGDNNESVEAGPQFSDALILSGGGQWGAYGAGFIGGWSANGRLPARIVTGISTGALQATYAYLGDDKGLVEAYSITSESQLVHRYGKDFFLRHASTADIAPLKDYVITHIGPLIPKVAAEYRASHRKLFVGAVDGLTGVFHMIDLTEIAVASDLSAPQRESCYTGALMASAAVPVVFRQVTINDRPWLDGGVRRAMFLPEMVRQISEARKHKQAGSVATDGKVWAIKNGTTEITPVAALPAKLLPTVGRIRSIVFNQLEDDSLDLAAFQARNFGLSLYYTSADGWKQSGLPECASVQSGEEDQIFDPAFMKCQIAFGKSRWKPGSDPWKPRKLP
ncbi:MAG: patatin-like phospholipase family protein [Sphingobium sp.]|nr:patatin-like phospholipase family protein [Sphingobium sp.]